MQFATISEVATIIAAGPPYRRNVSKVRASEKLIATLECGSVSVIRGATRTLNARINTNPRSRKPGVRLDTETARQSAPKPMVADFTYVERFSLSMTSE